MYACKILAPVLFHSCIAHWAVWNCALKEFIIIIIIIIYVYIIWLLIWVYCFTDIYAL